MNTSSPASSASQLGSSPPRWDSEDEDISPSEMIEINMMKTMKLTKDTKSFPWSIIVDLLAESEPELSKGVSKALAVIGIPATPSALHPATSSSTCSLRVPSSMPATTSRSPLSDQSHVNSSAAALPSESQLGVAFPTVSQPHVPVASPSIVRLPLPGPSCKGLSTAALVSESPTNVASSVSIPVATPSSLLHLPVATLRSPPPGPSCMDFSTAALPSAYSTRLIPPVSIPIELLPHFPLSTPALFGAPPPGPSCMDFSTAAFPSAYSPRPVPPVSLPDSTPASFPQIPFTPRYFLQPGPSYMDPSVIASSGPSYMYMPPTNLAKPRRSEDLDTADSSKQTQKRRRQDTDIADPSLKTKKKRQRSKDTDTLDDSAQTKKKYRVDKTNCSSLPPEVLDFWKPVEIDTMQCHKCQVDGCGALLDGSQTSLSRHLKDVHADTIRLNAANKFECRWHEPGCNPCKSEYSAIRDLARHMVAKHIQSISFVCPVRGCTTQVTHRKDAMVTHLNTSVHAEFLAEQSKRFLSGLSMSREMHI